MRKTIFANEEYYHIYNRGVDKRDVFSSEEDYVRFLTSMREFNTETPIGSLYENSFKNRDLGFGTPIGGPTPNSELVQIIAYCLNPNHFHMILKQVSKNGISDFMKKLGGGYTNYFNKKHSRSGSLFQGRFKSIHIDSNEYLLYLSAYVNANNFIHKYNEKPEDWIYSSYLDYIGKRNGKLCNKEIVLAQFNNNFSDYKKYISNNAIHLKEKKEMEGYLLE